ncbi:PilC/PilY family type IV pilus protein [Snodgrassella gandavensis]|uniref:PilC/PilY family type IV pilus protein n=1 Tax=Snodgrassella gandavensis TaxID=2946698 RepID=UPI0023B2B4BF|nr:PilC/PilY family type IV pilus protein [Snodgrassella gandavensis]
MRHKFVKNKKGKFLKGQKILFSAVTAALSAFPALPALAEVNIFADTPLYLQNSLTITTAYSVKPNITLFIDDSVSMNRRFIEGKDTFKCRSRTSIRKNARGRTVAWSPWSKYQYGLHEIPANTDDIQYRCREHRKVDGVKDVLLNILANYHNNMYFAFHPLHEGGIDPRYNTFYDTSDSTQYDTLTELIKDMPTRGATPITQRFPVMARNLVMNKLQYRCQKSYIVLLTDGEAQNQMAKSDADVDGYFDGEWQSDTQRHRFFHHDHDINKPHRLEFYSRTLNTKSFGDFIYDRNFYDKNGSHIYSGIQKRTTDNAGKAWNSPDPLNNNRPFTQTAETFTIGVALGERNSNLGRLAIPYLENGATPSTNFYNTNSQAEVMDAFAKIFESIKGSSETITITSTSTAPAVAVSQSDRGKISITAITESGSWGSKICIRQITDKVNKECTGQPSFNNRQLLLNDGSQTYLYPERLTGLNNDTFKISNNGKNQSEWLNGLLTWLSRSKPDNDIKTRDFVLDYRNRLETRDVGDIIDNPIITLADDENGGLQKYMITSANDGMVYVFRSTNEQNRPYDLKFNFMPMGIERQSNDGSDLVSHYYKDLTNNNYGKNNEHPHRFLLNGGMVAQQTERSNEKNSNTPRPQQTFMVSTMGQAGRGAFAINIGGNDLISRHPVAVDNIGSSDWYNNVALFQTPTGPNNYFGFTVGTPAIARIRVNEEQNASPTSVANHIREAAFISNGYNYSATLGSDHDAQPSSESALYIYDILGVDVGTDGYRETGFRKGELIAKLAPEVDANQDPDADGATGGLSSPTVIDINNDGVADIAYAADYSGNLYRFDLRSPDPSLWTVHKIFSAGKPITSAPGVILANNRDNLTAIITFGTGSDIYQSDLSSTKQQTVYGIYDDLTNPRPTEISRGTLLQQQLTTSNGYRQLSEHPFDPHVNKGWYFNLESDTGERVVTKPITASYAGVVFARKYKTTKDDDNQLEDPCVETKHKQENKVYTSVIQYNIKTGGRLKHTDPNFGLVGVPFGAVMTIEGLYSLTKSTTGFIGADGDPDVGRDGTQSPLRHAGPPPEACARAPVEGVDTEGNVIVIHVPKCPIRFKRLSWREVKTDYIN